MSEWYGIPTGFCDDAVWEGAEECYLIVEDCSGMPCSRCVFNSGHNLWKQLATIEPLKSMIAANKLAQAERS